jgi:hypothetical protein
MTERLKLSPRIDLLLSLTTLIYPIAALDRVEATQSPRINASVPELTEQIARSIDLTPERQNLLKAAVERAIASKQNGAIEPQIDGGKPFQPTPPLPKSTKSSQPSPTPKSKRDRTRQQSSEIIGQMRRPQIDR